MEIVRLALEVVEVGEKSPQERASRLLTPFLLKRVPELLKLSFNLRGTPNISFQDYTLLIGKLVFIDVEKALRTAPSRAHYSTL